MDLVTFIVRDDYVEIRDLSPKHKVEGYCSVQLSCWILLGLNPKYLENALEKAEVELYPQAYAMFFIGMPDFKRLSELSKMCSLYRVWILPACQYYSCQFL